MVLSCSAAATVTSSVLVQSDAAPKARLVEAYGKLPLSFEANQGQTDKQARFLARGPGYGLFLTPTEAVLMLRKPQVNETKPGTPPDQTSIASTAQKMPGALADVKDSGATTLRSTKVHYEFLQLLVHLTMPKSLLVPA
ncbi:MAG: hypothetical protein PHH26_05945 [Candidatus Thermoplasmatota archaeon]|nr:hypothetical protein [Candidatus Thermoplasmatota archaeon]